MRWGHTKKKCAVYEGKWVEVLPPAMQGVNAEKLQCKKLFLYGTGRADSLALRVPSYRHGYWKRMLKNQFVLANIGA